MVASIRNLEYLGLTGRAPVGVRLAELRKLMAVFGCRPGRCLRGRWPA
jgi:hypothetical protein